MSDICPFVFINLSGSSFIFDVFYSGEWARLASIKCCFVRLSKGSIRLFLSRLPARRSDFRRTPPVRDSTRPISGLAIWSPNLASRLTDCPRSSGKMRCPFFSAAHGCLRLHSAGPEGTSRTLAWPSPVKVAVGWRPRRGRRSLATGGTRGLEFLHFRMCVGRRHPSHPQELTERRLGDKTAKWLPFCLRKVLSDCTPRHLL